MTPLKTLVWMMQRAFNIDVGDIGHSLRFRASASAHLSRTFGTPTSSSIWTLSLWVKRGSLGGTFRLFGASTTTYLTFNSSDQLNLTLNGVSACTSTAVFRDPTAFYHIVYQQNGSAQTLWVNNVSVATGTTAAAIFNTAIAHQLGAANTSNYLDGYVSRAAFVDGTALTPSSFGYLNTNSNAWVSLIRAQVKAVVDAGGTNSFMLDFDDGASLTTLGYDKSSKGNNWTLNNISLTAGTTYDWMLDTPSNNYATLNPIVAGASGATNGNLTSSTTALRGTRNALLFDCKWEVTAGGSTVTAGVISGTGTTNTTSVTANKTFAFRLTTAGALDYKNVTDAGSWTSIVTGLTGEQYPYGVTQAANWNFGQAPLHASATYQSDAAGWFYDTTTGYKALCTANLSVPAVSNPKNAFDIALDTGANIKATTEALFPANYFEWIKDRANTNNHQLIDTVRGSTAVLQSNTTATETTFSTPAGNSVGWAWKASGTPVSNTAGSITSQVSANVEAGFSVVTYTGTGANATVGHGLGVAPKLVIVKQRNGSTYSWTVQHTAISAANVLALEATYAAFARAIAFNSTYPTSSVFSLGTDLGTNANTETYVAYCFAEVPGYSKISSYSGNGSADGPFVHCGFRLRFILIKRSDTAGSWYVYDTARKTYNTMNEWLNANTTAVENAAAGYEIDVLATGFKVRNAAAGLNASGGTYIFMAIAETASKYSNAR